jgi:glucan-binding YG repeat protein
MKSFLIIFFFGLSIILSSCATVINTTTQEVQINSVPSNAKITIDGKKFGTTPTLVNIERGSNHLIKLELDGYEVFETQITRKISSWYWLNLINGMLLGGLLDYINGSMYCLLPELLEVQLQTTKVVPPPTKK